MFLNDIYTALRLLAKDTPMTIYALHENPDVFRPSPKRSMLPDSSTRNGCLSME
jgi:hypothetical protein